MNFNLFDESHDNEYLLFRDTTEEVINLYGVPIKYIQTKKINQNDIFGEHSHIKIDKEFVHNFYVMLENTDGWEGDQSLFTKFGLQNFDTTNIFISRTDFEKVHPEITLREGELNIDNLPNGNLVVFGSNRIMEVTNFELSSTQHGNNNIFTSDREKNVYKLTLRTYIANHDDSSEANDISESDKFEYEDFGNLEKIFNSDEENFEAVVHKAENKPLKDEQIYPDPLRTTSIRDKEAEKNPFGEFG